MKLNFSYKIFAKSLTISMGVCYYNYIINSNDNVSFHSFFELIKEWLSERENVPQKQTDRREL